MDSPGETASRPADPLDADEDYYAAVERHFVRLRGSPLFITPQDWYLIHRWRQMQIPLEVVRRGLDRAFERRKSARAVRRLAYCRQSVEAAYRRHCEALAGGVQEARGEERGADVQGYFRELEAELRAVGKRSMAAACPQLAEAVLRCAERLAELALQAGPAQGLAHIELELDRMDEDLVRWGESCLEQGLRRRCREEAEQSLEEYRERMPKEVYASAVDSAYRKRVRAALRLPALSLFHV